VVLSGLPFLIGFLPLVLVGSWLVGRIAENQVKLWLIGASLLFYAIGDLVSLPIFVISLIGNHAVLRQMHRSRQPSVWAAIAIIADLALLSWFKFVPFACPLPLGLSFVTFSQIACLLYHIDGAEPPDLTDYCCYAAMFPALVAGPVMRPADMVSQCTRRTGWCPTRESLSIGLGFFLIGLVKKGLLADPLVPMIDQLYADPQRLSMLQSWQAACAYSLQLYFDFSGYSDMAIGLARMFNLNYPDNFDRPYRASSIIEYWQRWHMSLTGFVMTQVHRPLTLAIMRWRQQRGWAIDRAAQQSPFGFALMFGVPILVTMMLVALWHGPAAPFLLFGCVHTLFLLTNHGWRLFNAPRLPTIVACALTYLSVLIGAVIFRADSIATVQAVFAGMVGRHGVGMTTFDERDLFLIAWLTSLYLIVWFAPSTRQIMTANAPVAWRPSSVWAVAMGGAATIGLLASGGSGEFVYFRF
jgi:alginate O-acetyltransferase complex protein AlgI